MPIERPRATGADAAPGVAATSLDDVHAATTAFPSASTATALPWSYALPPMNVEPASVLPATALAGDRDELLDERARDASPLRRGQHREPDDAQHVAVDAKLHGARDLAGVGRDQTLERQCLRVRDGLGAGPVDLAQARERRIDDALDLGHVVRAGSADEHRAHARPRAASASMIFCADSSRDSRSVRTSIAGVSGGS
jgi:hypothetical protein